MTKSERVSVERFVRDLIAIGGVYNVDHDGYVISKSDEEDATIKIDNVEKRLLVIKDVIEDKDAQVINPLNENVAETPDSKWIYALLNVGLSKRVKNIARFLATVVESEKAKEDVAYSTEVLNFAARHKDFDAKVLAHFETMSKDLNTFMKVWYNRNLKEAYFRCAVLDPDTHSEFPQVTKKALRIIISFICDIFDIDNHIDTAAQQLKEKYATSSSLLSVPKLESILGTYLKIYSQLNIYLEMVDYNDPDFIVDITSLGYHLKNIEKYYQKAKWFTTSATVVPSKPQMRIEDTGGIPSNPAIVRPTMIGYTEPPSNIPSNPARYQQPDYMQPMGYPQQPMPGYPQQPMPGYPQQPMPGYGIPIQQPSQYSQPFQQAQYQPIPIRF